MMFEAETQKSRLAGLLGIPLAHHEPVGVVSLAGLLDAHRAERLASSRARLAGELRPRVLGAYRQAFAQGGREASLLCSEALAARRLPPCFRHDVYRRFDYLTDAERFDLLAHDLQWIQAMYPEHWRKAIGGYSGMLHGPSWLAVAEYYWATKNRSQIWLMVRHLALTEDQQWECAVLRSAPIKRAAYGLLTQSATVHRAITDRLRKANRTHRGHYALEPVYERRFKVWVCGEMTGSSPTKAARLYGMWTGSELTRGVAHKDLEWVRARIPESRKRRRAKGDKHDMR